jgi:hypothetical protein
LKRLDSPKQFHFSISSGSAKRYRLTTFKDTFVKLGINVEEKISLTLFKNSKVESFKQWIASITDRMRNNEKEDFFS